MLRTSHRPSLVTLLVASLLLIPLFACGGDDDRTGGDGGGGGGMANPLWAELFGANDAMLPGLMGCTPREDQCRGSGALYVCIDPASGDAVVPGTCSPCTTDEQCMLEYSYYAIPFCGEDGQCHPEPASDMTGECDTTFSQCATATQNFVCVDGMQCGRCTEDPQCMSQYGADRLCNVAMGVCERSGR